MTSDQNIPTGIIEVLRDALDRPIAFHRVFVKLTGSVTAALMLSQAVYWSKRANTNDEGWFFKTAAQWEDETGLSRFEQEGARKALKRSSFWKEELRGVPAKMHYRVDIKALTSELVRYAESDASQNKPNKNARLLKTSKLGCGKAASKIADNQHTSTLESSEHNKGVSETTTETIKTTTPLTPLNPVTGSTGGDPGGGRVLIEKAIAGTLLANADIGRIMRAAVKYNRCFEEISLTVDILDQQYQQSKRKIEDSTALVVTALKEGITLPDGYIPKAQREAEDEARREAVRQKNDQLRKAEEDEKQVYAQAEITLMTLSEKDREQLFDEARAGVHKSLRASSKAVKSMALQIIIAKARAPDNTK